MMKNLTKAALLLAAATAFLFAACSHSSGGSKDPTPETVSVTGVSVSPSSVSVEEGQAVSVTATVAPDDATDKTVYWASENPEIATVTGNDDGTATVKGVKAGETTITVKTKDSNHEAKVPVTVYPEGTLVEVESVEIAADKTTITAGETATITAKIMPSDATDKSLTWNSSDTDVATVTGNEDGTATVTGKAAGTAKITATASNGEESNEITITVEANSGDKTYAWDFSATDLKTYLSLDGNKLEFETTYESTPAGLTLTFPQNLKINEIDLSKAISGTAAVDFTSGAIQLTPDDDGEDVYVEVEGPFTAVMVYASNSGSAATGRHAYIKIDGEEVVASGESIPVAGAELKYTHSEAGKVKVGFGATNFLRIYDIKITTANANVEGKTEGEVKSKATFVSQTNDTTENNTDTLGLVGTSADSTNPSVATATVDGGKVKITSHGMGSATITVKDGDKTATIEVTVKLDGTISLGAITKYVDPNIVVEQAQWTVTAADGVGVVTGDDGLTVAFVDKDGKTKSANNADFKFDGSNAALTLTTPKLAQGKNITITVTGKSGSNGNASDITLTATNATATNNNVTDNKITFPNTDRETTDTFVYTVTAQNPVVLEFKRLDSKTTRLSKLEITVGN